MLLRPTQRALWEFFALCFTGGPLFFVFQIQTKAIYFVRTILTGNAQYRATGRGFVTRHTPFDELYRFFAATHIVPGFTLVAALTLFALTTELDAVGTLSATWMMWQVGPP